MSKTKIAILISVLMILSISIFIISTGKITDYASTDNLKRRNIYVSNSGDDNNNGLSKNKPKKSISSALALSLPGDSILLMSGTYFGQVDILKNSEPDKPIIIKSFSSKPDEFAVIDGNAPKPSIGASNLWLNIKSSSWLVFENLRFQNGWEDPISISDSSYLTFSNCYFSGGRRVIYATGTSTHHILVQNSYWDQGGDALWKMQKAPNGEDAWTEMHHGSLSFFNGSLFCPKGTGGSHVIRANKVVNAFNGFRWKGVDSSEKPSLNLDSNIEVYDNDISNIRDNDIEPEGSVYNLHVYHNRTNNAHKTMSVDGVIGGYLYYYGNTVTSDTKDPWAASIATGWWKVYNKLSYPMYAFNNSFYGNSRAFSSMDGEARYLKHFNNAYCFTGSSRTWDLNKWDKTMEFDYDCSNKAWPDNIKKNNQEQHGIIGDPGFTDGSKLDFRLKQSSPCLDAGRVLEIPEFNWKQAYEGKSPDIGAFENDRLVEGPPFKFMSPPGGVSYAERPRIARHRFENGSLRLYFSADLKPDSITASDVRLKSESKTAPAEKITFTGTRELLINTSEPLTENKYKIEFKKMPIGADGESATCWASTIECECVY